MSAPIRNKFFLLPPVQPNAVGPQPSIDLYSPFSAPTGIDPPITFICKGDFIEGAIAVEGSPNGIDWDVICQFDSGRDANDSAGPPIEFSPIVKDVIVRFLRANVQSGTKVRAQTRITAAGEQNCKCEFCVIETECGPVGFSAGDPNSLTPTIKLQVPGASVTILEANLTTGNPPTVAGGRPCCPPTDATEAQCLADADFHGPFSFCFEGGNPCAPRDLIPGAQGTDTPTLTPALPLQTATRYCLFARLQIKRGLDTCIVPGEGEVFIGCFSTLIID